MTSLAIRMKALGAVRALVVGLPLRGIADRVACRVPARRPGNFHLVGQMKVTKAKALNATPFTRSARCGTPAQRATWKPCGTSNPPRTRRRGPRKASPAQSRWIPDQSAARPRRVSCRFDWRRWRQVARRAGCARREERAERFCTQPLCFGDFHLGPQMLAKRGSAHFAQRSYADTKATRPPGRDPAGGANSRVSNKQSNDDRVQRATSRPLCSAQWSPRWR
jgi:hypothetical protein